MKTILLTGGLGYIGSHTAIALGKAGYNIVILDNLANSKTETLAKIESIVKKKISFIQADLTHDGAIDLAFTSHNIDAVIHLAGMKAVAESWKIPLDYYGVNLVSTLNLLAGMQRYGCTKLVFSSSTTVYGNSPSPLDETSEVGKGITSPYGRTKYMIECILEDVCSTNNNMCVVSLRYFNPIGAHESGCIKEDPNGTPNNLLPIIMNVHHKKQDRLFVYGTDYDTPDGTCVRDFVHVMDVAEGHLAALRHMDGMSGFNTFNLGTGKGTSVQELITMFERASGEMLPKVYTGRRQGDQASTYASVDKAWQILNWRATRTVEDAIRHTLL